MDCIINQAGYFDTTALVHSIAEINMQNGYVSDLTNPIPEETYHNIHK